MSEEHRKINYDLAKAEADKVDEQIIAALQNGISFRVEAGAGSGKTKLLNGFRQTSGQSIIERNRL